MAMMQQQAQQAAQQAAAAAPVDPNKVAADPAAEPTTAPQGPEAQFGAEPPAGAEVTAEAPEGEEATPEEQKAYEDAMSALHKVMYTNQGTSEAIADMLQPEDKIGSTVKAGVMVIQQLDQKIDMDENIIAEMTAETADRLMEMGERAKGMQFTDQEAQAVAGATWEGVMQMFGVDEEQYNSFMSGMAPEEIDKQKKTYESFLGQSAPGAQQGGPQNG